MQGKLTRLHKINNAAVERVEVMEVKLGGVLGWRGVLRNFSMEEQEERVLCDAKWRLFLLVFEVRSL